MVPLTQHALHLEHALNLAPSLREAKDLLLLKIINAAGELIPHVLFHVQNQFLVLCNLVVGLSFDRLNDICKGRADEMVQLELRYPLKH